MDYFGIREVCNVTLRSLRNIPACRSMTGKNVKKGEPVMYFDYLKVSNISGTVATVYATGGRGNTRRLSWDGDKEITFHIEDALISPTSMAILTAAQLVKRRVMKTSLQSAANVNDIVIITDAGGVDSAEQNVITIPTGFDQNAFMSWGIIEVTLAEANEDGNTSIRILSNEVELVIDNGAAKLFISSDKAQRADGTIIPITSVDTLDILVATGGNRPVYKHEKYTTTAAEDGKLELKHIPYRDGNHPLFVFDVHDDGSIDLLSEIYGSNSVTSSTAGTKTITNANIYQGNDYIVDYYRKVTGNVTSLVVTADGTSDYYKLEGESLMKRESDGQDIPVVITIPKVRPRAQFEIPMSASGDPAVFSFDFDVFPAYDSSYSSCDDNVMVIIDIIEDDEDDCNCVVESVSDYN